MQWKNESGRKEEKREMGEERERETDTETENLSETLRYFRDP